MINQIDRTNIPKHIAVIMDGNGRWAQKQGVKRIFGHQNAIEAVRSVTEGSAELGVGFLTLYAFSTENWERPKYEVDGLMTLLVNTIKDELPTLQENNISLATIGDTAGLPVKAQEKLKEAIDLTSSNTGMKLVLALNYSGKWDLVQAMNKIIQEGIAVTEPSDVDMHLSTWGMPDPDLLIRTSGEMRISNFLLWQLAYAELHFSEVLWPDFRKKDLYEAIISYQRRERRFGKTSDQVKA
ncbi:MAG: isoprenyl transferase [Ekhidna sp.]|uniref:isoprenyl transferase n=1 Tax=Ekhidna sp. TaxID=2608089 RepID=UPI0032F03C13